MLLVTITQCLCQQGEETVQNSQRLKFSFVSVADYIFHKMPESTHCDVTRGTDSSPWYVQGAGPVFSGFLFFVLNYHQEAEIQFALNRRKICKWFHY